MSAAGLIATHMNAPYGRLIQDADVIASLRNGKLSAASADANAILGGMFGETAPALIARCAIEAGVSLKQVNVLYRDTLALGFMPCPKWEQVMEALA